MIRKWIEVNDILNGQYSVNKNIRFKTILSRSDFRDYSDAYNAAKRKMAEALIMTKDEMKIQPLGIMLHLGHACHKLMINS